MLGAIRSVYLQLGLPDRSSRFHGSFSPLKGFAEGEDRSRSADRSLHVLARANSALPLDLWGRGLACWNSSSCCESQIVGESNPRLGLRVKDIAEATCSKDEVQVVASKLIRKRDRYEELVPQRCRGVLRARHRQVHGLAVEGVTGTNLQVFSALVEAKHTRGPADGCNVTWIGEELQAYTPHLLRFGGASAMWAGGFDSYVLKAWGRSARMAAADMTPIRGFPSA